MAKLFLRKKITDRIPKGHNWVFQNEVGDIIGDVKSGDEISVFSSAGSFVGKGWYAAQSSITVRIMTRDIHQMINEAFISDKISQAIRAREAVLIDQDAYRIFNAEADGISGLYIDKWQSFYVVQCVTYALDLRFDWIQKALVRLGIPIGNILKDNNVNMRKFEDLSIAILSDFPNPVFIKEDDMHFVCRHQKDLSLDRRNWRAFVNNISEGKVVWDLCCGNGNLGQAALQGGAVAVTFVDNEKKWQSRFTQMNLQGDVHFVLDNVFDFLKKRHHTKPDIILLDPPVFNENPAKPLSGYYELIVHALGQLSANGVLLIGNSSSKIENAAFEKLFQSVQITNDLHITMIHRGSIPVDFGWNPLYPHLDYMHFWALQKC